MPLAGDSETDGFNQPMQAVKCPSNPRHGVFSLYHQSRRATSAFPNEVWTEGGIALDGLLLLVQAVILTFHLQSLASSKTPDAWPGYTTGADYGKKVTDVTFSRHGL